MYAPIFLPQAEPPSAEVRAAESAILAAEGPHHVAGRYYASVDDADRQRRGAAERMVREAARRTAYEVAQNATQDAGPDWRSRWERGVAPAASRQRSHTPRAVAWLAPADRVRVALGLDGHLTLTHRDTLDAVHAELVRDATDAVLVSAARVRLPDVPGLARLVRGFPGVPVLGVATEATGPETLTGALLLGRAGVSTVFDCRSPVGLAALRGAVAPRHLPDAFQRTCVASILAEIGDDSTGGIVRFFAAVFSPDAASAKRIAASLGVHPTTLASRFLRAGLPSVRRYVSWARLVWAARLAEAPGLSISAIAFRLDASSPQSFNRTIRTLTGHSAQAFRRAFTGAAMLARYRETLVTPHRDTLRAFDPFGIESRRGVECGTEREPITSTVGRAA